LRDNVNVGRSKLPAPFDDGSTAAAQSAEASKLSTCLSFADAADMLRFAVCAEAPAERFSDSFVFDGGRNRRFSALFGLESCPAAYKNKTNCH